MFKDGTQSTLKQDGPKAPVTEPTEVNINTATLIVRGERRLTLRALSEILKITIWYHPHFGEQENIT